MDLWVWRPWAGPLLSGLTLDTSSPGSPVMIHTATRALCVWPCWIHLQHLSCAHAAAVPVATSDPNDICVYLICLMNHIIVCILFVLFSPRHLSWLSLCIVLYCICAITRLQYYLSYKLLKWFPPKSCTAHWTWWTGTWWMPLSFSGHHLALQVRLYFGVYHVIKNCSTCCRLTELKLHAYHWTVLSLFVQKHKAQCHVSHCLI